MNGFRGEKMSLEKIIIDFYDQVEKEKPLRAKLHKLFNLGREVGQIEYTSAAKHTFSCGYDQLKKEASQEFAERDRLIDELVKDFFSKGEA